MINKEKEINSLRKEIDSIASLEELNEKYRNFLPKHLGIIMDGNRRWIKRRGLNDVSKGHLAGYQTLKDILLPIFDAGINYLTVYALSSENIKNRNEKEVKFLFSLLLKAVDDVIKEPLIHENQVRVRLIGRLYLLPKSIQERIKEIEKVTAHYNKCFINVCVVYDGQEEIVDAVKSIVQKFIPAESSEQYTGDGSGNDKLTINDISKDLIKKHLYTHDFPELDYIIRTGMDDGARISGFLLWDASYAEFKFRNELWPDYNKEMLFQDLKDYLKRNRRLGK